MDGLMKWVWAILAMGLGIALIYYGYMIFTDRGLGIGGHLTFLITLQTILVDLMGHRITGGLVIGLGLIMAVFGSYGSFATDDENHGPN